MCSISCPSYGIGCSGDIAEGDDGERVAMFHHRYNTSVKGRSRQHAYASSPASRDRHRRYNSSVKGRSRQHAYDRRRRKGRK